LINKNLSTAIYTISSSAPNHKVLWLNIKTKLIRDRRAYSGGIGLRLILSHIRAIILDTYPGIGPKNT
jgi:hypothetical protein